MNLFYSSNYTQHLGFRGPGESPRVQAWQCDPSQRSEMDGSKHLPRALSGPGASVPAQQETTRSVCRRGSPADGESDLPVSVCALYILLVGNEFTNPVSMGNSLPTSGQMGGKDFHGVHDAFPSSWLALASADAPCAGLRG